MACLAACARGLRRRRRGEEMPRAVRRREGVSPDGADALRPAESPGARRAIKRLKIDDLCRESSVAQASSPIRGQIPNEGYIAHVGAGLGIDGFSAQPRDFRSAALICAYNRNARSSLRTAYDQGATCHVLIVQSR